MRQRERDGSRDKAVMWTIVGTGAGVVAFLFVVPIGRRKEAARARKRQAITPAERAARARARQAR